MIDSVHNILSGEQFRQIEDIIDARKMLGQYNIFKQSNGTNCRYAYSNSTSTSESGRLTKYDDMIHTFSDGNNNLHNLNIKQTDSEITVVRLKCRKTTLKNRQDKWDMHDIAIPGDGRHLGESPSLVNLVTLVGYNVPCEGEEYLVPLSSWEPYGLKHDDISSDLKCYSETYFDVPSTSKKNVKLEDHSAENRTGILEIDENDDGINLVFRRHSWAGRISKFGRKHCSKTKSLSESCQEYQDKN